MVEYNKVNVRLSDTQLKKRKTAVRNKALDLDHTLTKSTSLGSFNFRGVPRGRQGVLSKNW